MAKNWCIEHEIAWFKKGNMKNYAHPVKDAQGNLMGWCNRPEDFVETDTSPELEPPNKDKVIGEHVGLKELGARIGDGSIDRDFPKSGVSIKSQYYKKVSELTGIDFKKGE